ncbi:MAG: signal peptidase II [Bacilli bacterium]|nr:signal peptidase II [Bacilli bacterium]
MKEKINNHLIKLVTILILFLDQLTKFLFTNERIIIIKDLFSINYCENYGAAWSLFNNRVSGLILISIVILIFLIKYKQSFLLNIRNKIAFGLVFGGLFGNLIDRIIHGFVKDFISVIIFNYHFPVFNIADIAIVVGMILILIAVLKKEDMYGKNSSNKRVL